MCLEGRFIENLLNHISLTITLFRAITMFCIVHVSHHSDWIWGIFHIILSIPHNTIMALKNVMTWALAFSYHTTSLASLNSKPVGPCQCIYQALKFIFWGPRPPWSLCHLFLNVTKVVLGQLRQPINYLAKPWSNFMVHKSISTMPR